jgi:hypothetical protein
MLVDVVMPGWIPFKGLAVSQDIPGWIRAHDVALGYAWQTLVGGHLGRLGNRADAELQKQYVADLQASARATVASLDPTPFFQKYGPTGNSWAIFKAYLDAASQQAADPIVAKYTANWQRRMCLRSTMPTSCSNRCGSTLEYSDRSAITHSHARGVATSHA